MSHLDCLVILTTYIGHHDMYDPEHIIKSSKPTTESQYQALKAELESIGYHLKVVTRQSAKDIEIRKQESQADIPLKDGKHVKIGGQCLIENAASGVYIFAFYLFYIII